MLLNGFEYFLHGFYMAFTWLLRGFYMVLGEGNLTSGSQRATWLHTVTPLLQYFASSSIYLLAQRPPAQPAARQLSAQLVETSWKRWEKLSRNVNFAGSKSRSRTRSREGFCVLLRVYLIDHQLRHAALCERWENVEHVRTLVPLLKSRHIIARSFLALHVFKVWTCTGIWTLTCSLLS